MSAALPGKRTSLYAIAALAVLQAAKVAHWVRGVRWHSSLPLLNAGYAPLYAQVLRAHEFFTRTGHGWGFDPFVKAGTAAGLGPEPGSYVVALVCHGASRWISIGHTLLMLEITGLLVAPAALALAVYWFSRSRLASGTSFAILLLYGLFTAQWSYQMASFLALIHVAAFWRWLERRTWLRAGVLAGVTAVLFSLHPGILLVVLVPDVLLMAAWRRLSLAAYAALAGIVAAVGILNGDWIAPSLTLLHWRTGSSLFPTQGALSLFAGLNPIQPSWEGSVRVVLSGIVIVAAAQTLRRLPARTRAFFLTWLGAMALVGAYGSRLPFIRGLEPGQILFPVYLLLYGLASLQIPRVLEKRTDLQPLAVGLTAMALFLVFRNPLALTNALPASEQPLVTYVTRNAPMNGRVMIETIDAPAFPIVDYLGATARQPLVTLPSVSTMTEKDFSERLALDNVSLVAACSTDAVQILAGYTETLEPLGPLGRYICFRVRRPSGWFVSGQGMVAFDFDRVTLTELSAGPVVLKLHWLPTLRTDPPLSIQGVMAGDDPMPFIGLDVPEGTRQVTITNAA